MKRNVFLGLLVFVLVIGIFGCGGDDDEKYNCTHCNDAECEICKPVVQNPGDVFGVEFENLEGKSIVINFPVAFDATEQATLMTRLQNIIGRLDTKAGEDAAFKAKVNALMGKGFTIVVEDTNAYDFKIVDGKLFISTDNFNSNNNNAIATDIIGLINAGKLVKAQQMKYTPSACHYCLVSVTFYYKLKNII